MVSMSTELAVWLNREATRRNLSLRDVAKEAGVSHTTVIGIANGERTNPEAKTVAGLARVFGADPIEVYRLAGILPPRRVVMERGAAYLVNDESRLLELYRELPENDRGLVMDLVERLTGRTVARIVGATDATDQSG